MQFKLATRGLSVAVLVAAAFCFAPNALANSYSAYNWAGYVADQGTYTSVSSSWTVPSMSSSGDYSANTQWVGIGGFQTPDLIQTGTRAVAHNGEVTYTAWYELIPFSAVVVPLTIAPNDSLSASITELAPDTWEISLVDGTSGSFNTTVSYHSLKNSAEWIEEMPTGERGYLTLGNFSSIAFTYPFATRNGSSTPLAKLPAHTLTMVTDQGAILAAPSLSTSLSYVVKQF